MSFFEKHIYVLFFKIIRHISGETFQRARSNRVTWGTVCLGNTVRRGKLSTVTRLLEVDGMVIISASFNIRLR